ncbi:hypothetical protein DM793_03905 [Paenarthrobacter nitroguajacolicus]|uniref:RHS repeat-associated core domain-containing protein n=1 Tax=Paenarthrobacter nitroguajacolicus TaxID=211146 RepID=UPI0015BE2D9C|nr:RHS repeat-associated core domain-containing protein [Paenarthrobacter nitroguajacolicus]NWL10447.1 hypothetical protein [Paenarthrobacter nitroguajacolicus]
MDSDVDEGEMKMLAFFIGVAALAMVLFVSGEITRRRRASRGSASTRTGGGHGDSGVVAGGAAASSDGLVSIRTSAGARLYYTTDALGSVVLLTDSNQTKVATYTYDSWGNTTATGTQAPANPWQYAGGYKDTTTGYTKFGARYYNPTTGRFTQPDPSRQEANAYLYAGANPVNNTDGSGLSYVAFSVTGCLVGCFGASVGYDATNGWQAGFFGGIGARAELSGSLVGGFGEMGGSKTQTSAECGIKGGPGATFGLGLSSPDFYGGPAFGLGGGCSLMFTNYIGLG